MVELAVKLLYAQVLRIVLLITDSMGVAQPLAYFTKLLSKSTRHLLCFYSFDYGFGNYDLN